jgi:hypothetical protein
MREREIMYTMIFAWFAGLAGLRNERQQQRLEWAQQFFDHLFR